MPSSDREMFKYFREQKDTSREIDHLAYASYAYAKYEWMDHLEKTNGRPPSMEEENAWIQAIPHSRLEEFTDLAFDFFDFAARKYLVDEIEKERKEAVEASIMGRIEEITSFRSTFFPNLVVGLSASLIFSVLVIVMGVIYAHDPSPISLYKAIVPDGPATHAVQSPSPVSP